MSHDPLCPSQNEKMWALTPYDGECACERYAVVRADERERILAVISDRLQDLRSCNRDDDCLVKADGIALALDDLRGAW